MKSISHKLALPLGLGLLVGAAVLLASAAYAQLQWPNMASQTPMAQRNAQNLVVNQVKMFQNTTRTASSFSGNGYGQLVQAFQAVRDQYGAFTATLTPDQASNGANQWAELSSGLDIIAEAFNDYQTAVANGQDSGSAFSNMAQVLNEAMGVWLQEFKQDCSRLRVGW
jgi:hypothetical protein